MTTDTAAWGPLAIPPRTDAPADVRPWRDNAFFCFWDVEQDLYGSVHVSGSPNATGGRRARMTVQLAGDVVELVEPLGFGTWAGPSMSFDAETVVRVATPELSGTLTGFPLHAPAVFAGDAAVATLSLDEDQPVHHYQRSAVVRGELLVRGRRVVVNGIGYRDRSWGLREESATMQEYVGLMWVLGDVSVSALKLMLPSGAAVTIGFLLDQDGSDPITDLAFTRDAAGHVVRTRLETVAGRVLEVASTRRAATSWCPMGADLQVGPTLSAYDQFDHLVTTDGVRGAGLVEQGILRRLT